MSMIDFPKEEEKVLDKWNKDNIFDLVNKQDSPMGDFVFFEGPPTANAPPALHHVLSRVYKDVVLRFKTMQGFHIDRKAGWDTHGLPVELQVEKKLGISGKPQIENIVENDKRKSIIKFNEECKEMVWGYVEEWEKLTHRIGFWLDFKNPYITYTNEYIESVWWVIKQIWDKGLIYKGHKVVPYCSRCGTALSTHEVAQGYKSVEDESVFIKFPLIGENNTYFLSWTTTPWTLPGNVALAVGEDIEYVYASFTGKTYILAKERLEILQGEYEILKTVKGKDLIGMKYEPLFDIPALVSDTSYTVYAADFVTDTDGTGIVHTAVMYGEDDYMLGEEIGLPQHHTVDSQGNFVSQVPDGLAGKYVKGEETEKLIITLLQNKGLLLGKEMYSHEYPFCWRCDTPLLYYARDSWFIRVSSVRDSLVENNNSINWEPSHIKEGRFGEWLFGIRDWALSRERYWGTPLPIWECVCGLAVCVGSKQELNADEKLELHRPYVDDIEISCNQCSSVMHRVPEVIDVWFDSGAMPVAQWGFPNKEGSEEQLTSHYPADYISEAIDQTRGWFYTLLSIATLLEKEAPYKNVICLGHILDSKGEKMSKSKGNVVDPWEVINTHGVDALRWHLYTMSQAGEPKRFDIKGVDQAKRRTLMIWLNILEFYKLYKDEEVIEQEESSLDKWLKARLNETIKEVTDHLEAYDITRAGRYLHDFITDLSTWWLRRSRIRFKQGDKGVVIILKEVLLTTSKLMAPFTPFISELVYSETGEGKSVHLDKWPEYDRDLIDQELINKMNKLRLVVENGLRLRAEAGIKIRQPLQRFEYEDQGVEFDSNETEILMTELNVKEVIQAKEYLLDTTLTDSLKIEGLSREIIRTINGMRKDSGLTRSDSISVIYSGSDTQVFETFGEEIKKAVIAKSIELGDVGEKSQSLKSDWGEIQISIKKT